MTKCIQGPRLWSLLPVEVGSVPSKKMLFVIIAVEKQPVLTRDMLQATTLVLTWKNECKEPDD